MTYLISITDVIEEISKGVWNVYELIDRIKALPSADTVKAVQDCRNCKYGSYNDHLETWFCNHNCECSNWDMWESADAVMRDATAEERASVQRYIDSISTEAVQVVRCKDCRWWNGSQETMHNNHLCRNWSKFGSINTSADDYCSWGERR